MDVPERVTFTFPRSSEQRLANTIAAMHCHLPIPMPEREGLWFVTSVREQDGVVTVEAMPWTGQPERATPSGGKDE